MQLDAPRRANSAFQAQTQVMHCVTEPGLDRSLQRFWELEEIPDSKAKWKPEDQACDDLFRQTHRRNVDGRYVVRLPLKSDLPDVSGETRRMASGSLLSMHRRFSRDPVLAQDYREFMTMYRELGHMIPVPSAEVNRAGVWYLPHHAVVHTLGTKRKLRVVFDASRQTPEGHTLNR